VLYHEDGVAIGTSLVRVVVPYAVGRIALHGRRVILNIMSLTDPELRHARLCYVANAGVIQYEIEVCGGGNRGDILSLACRVLFNRSVLVIITRLESRRRGGRGGDHGHIVVAVIFRVELVGDVDGERRGQDGGVSAQSGGVEEGRVTPNETLQGGAPICGADIFRGVGIIHPGRG
jgi:hypothetical protein